MMTNNHKTLTKMIIQTQIWEDGTVRSNHSLTATSHPRPPPSLYRLSRWAAGLAKCDSNHIMLSWTSSISNWSATAVNVLSSWTHLHSSDPYIAFHYNCRSNSDDLENISTCSNCGNLIIFAVFNIVYFQLERNCCQRSDLLEHIFIPQIQILHSTTNCRLNTDGLENIFTGSNWSTTTSKIVITFSPAPIVATTASQTDLLGQFHKMWSRLSAVECCHILWKWSFD